MLFTTVSLLCRATEKLEQIDKNWRLEISKNVEQTLTNFSRPDKMVVATCQQK